MADTVDDDVKTLHPIGYAQELSRRMSGFSNFRDLLLDHLHPGRRHHLLLDGDRDGRRLPGLDRLARRRKLTGVQLKDDVAAVSHGAGKRIETKD